MQTINGFRLSPQQKYLWLLQQDSPAYRAQCAILIEGNLQANVLKEALQKVSDRHEIIRTSFQGKAGLKNPIQVISEHSSVSWNWVNLSEVTPQEQEAKLEEIFQQEKSALFNFERNPVWHLSLITLSSERHILLVSLPALCADSRTLKNLVQEISQCYAACLHSQEITDEVVQYIQFSEWQNELLEDEEAPEGKEYWTGHNYSALASLRLPFENRLINAPAQFTPQSFEVKLELALLVQLEAIARQYNTSLSTFLLACWKILLWRLIGQSELTVGVAFDGRKYEELEPALGLFAKFLPLSSQLTENFSFAESLQQIQQEEREAYKYQEYFSHEYLGNSSGFPFGFEFEEQLGKHSASGVGFSIYKQYACCDRFKVKLSCHRQNDSLAAEFHYDPIFLADNSIRCLAQQFYALVQSAATNPQTAIGKLQMLSDRARNQLLVEFNSTKADYQLDKCVHQLFEEQAERSPNRIAAVCENQQITYSELNARANQIAHYLQQLGIKPEVIVGICVDRSLEAIAGILGILKAGGAYLPLDPAMPKERLALMLQNAQTSVLLTQQHLINNLPETKAYIVCLDKDIPSFSPTTFVSACGENLAYIIYTSGSTGTPKGVAIEHRQLLNYLQGIQEKLNLPSGANYATVSTFAADLGNTVIFPALCSGGCLHIISQERATDPQAIAAYFQQHSIDCLKIVPSHLKALLSASNASQILPKKRLILGGEPLMWNLIETIQKYNPDCSIFNHYGPTETTVGVLTYQVRMQGDRISQTVPLGRPLPNTQIYLLDSHLQPVPVGVAGELYIAGAGLARGYLNQPELTAEKFICKSLTQEPETRLYKTGDLARYLPDGNIEFIGRVDHQVKLRGFRIELGEIEAVLGQHPAVDETVVVAREDVPGNKRLVAYLVVNQAAAPTIPQLQQFLKQKLPEYMVPNTFVLLDALPLTSNGKIDRRALPAPDTSRPFGEGAYVAPQTPVEELLAGIWAQVLAVEQVSIHDNFFDLGGHSLRATQMISRVRDTFGVEFPLRGLFESPTVAALSEHLEAFRRTEQGLVAPPLLPVPREGELLLSFAQARLWFLEQLEPGSSTYNIPAAVRLTGALHVAALKQSLNEIVWRHEALRTTFGMVSGEPIQVIAPVKALTLQLVDLSDLPEAQQETSVKRLATESAQQPFDLAMGPLLRATLLHLGEAEHVVLLTMHHIVSDGWSMGVLIRELAALYKAFSSGKPSPLPPLPIQYADFAHWQRQWLQGEVLAAQLSYWQQQLAGAQTVLELPTDRPRPAVQTFSGATQLLALPEPLSQKLKTLSQRWGVTLFMTLLAAFQTLLYRYTGQEDICIGSPIANRNRTETEELIGFFVNTLVLRTDMSENPSFQELLGRVREVTLGAYAHQDLPFEQLVEALEPERTLSHHPLFQVMFVLQNAPMSALELPHLTLRSLPMESSTAKFDLTLSMQDTEQGLMGSLEYNTDLFDAATISRMREHFQTLLEAIVAEPEQRLSDLPLLTQLERQQLLVEWNDTQVDYPKDVCVHQLFEAQAEQTPEAVAVVFESQQLTYRELNRRANQVAHHLRSLGVGPDTLVGICVERSLEMIVGLLGILKAGGAYVPLDPAYPSERLTFMLEDSQAPVLLTQQHIVVMLPRSPTHVVYLDVDSEAIALHSLRNPTSNVTGNNLAYTIYTSGSTGKPKGVQILHGAVVNFLTSMRRCPGLTSQDTLLSVTTLSFDIAALELFLPLSVGAGIVMVSRSVATDGTQLLERLNNCGATVMQGTPATWQLLLAAGWSGSHQMKILCGGEALSRELANQLLEKGASLWNLYGPTEATIWSTIYQVDNTDGTVSIGRPIANTQIYLLDEHLQPVPVGVPGELYIGGAGLARGYLNRPELTAQKFIVNPLSHEPKACLYKTGDLARYRSDGNIEYLGRIDHQVKIRGFRIELGEIEAVLGQHPAVQETVVMVREDVPGNKRLVAYVVVNQTSVPTVSQLHQFLKQKLPEYMIPSAIVKLEALPLTPNGKVDRRALLAPDTARPELQSAFVAPRDTLELQLAQIWEDVLNVRPIGVTDNFFTLGGHSLLAVRLIALLQQQFGQNLPLATLFLAPTIEHLASTLGQPTDERQWSPLVKIQSGGSKRPFFCVPGAGGNVIYFYHLARHLGSDQPFYGLQARGLDGEQMPHTQVEDMAAYYIEALQTVQPQGPYLLGGHSFGSKVAFEMALQLLHQGQEVALLAILDAPAPLPTNKPVEVEHDDDARYLTELAMTIEQLVGKKLSVSYEHLQPLAPNEQLNYILERLKTANVFPPEAKLSQLRGLVQVFKANHQTHYVLPEVYPNQITVFPASEQFRDDPAMGWDKASSEPVETYSVPGDHNTMLAEPHVRVLAEKLRACLDKAQADDERK